MACLRGRGPWACGRVWCESDAKAFLAPGRHHEDAIKTCVSQGVNLNVTVRPKLMSMSRTEDADLQKTQIYADLQRYRTYPRARFAASLRIVRGTPGSTRRLLCGGGADQNLTHRMSRGAGLSLDSETQWTQVDSATSSAITHSLSPK